MLKVKDYKRILTIQDISCVGQCSLTVALPVLSACGVETAVLPSAVLSTHTAGFKDFTFRDLTCDMEPVRAHWSKEGIRFDGFYTGYLGSKEQISECLKIFETTAAEDSIIICDPAMADNGKLYPAFDMDFVASMRELCGKADIVVPNITEAALLTGEPYKTDYKLDYPVLLCKKLMDNGAKTVVLTGVSLRENKTGVLIADACGEYYYEHELLPNGCHGTGDVYASAFAGAVMRGKNVNEAAKIAADYTVLCIKNTAGDKDHWYGVKFEPVLGKLIEMLEK